MQAQLKDIDRLTDIQEFAAFILEHRNIEEAQFYSNKILKYALLKALEIIGEASRQISRGTRAEFSDLEWDKMISARHVYVHEYFNVDWTKIWISLNTIDFLDIIKKCQEAAQILKNRFSL